jgi:hypothetical protein
MGIWNTSASPIGFAYQSARGPGINIKPIDPRVYQSGSGSSNRRSSDSSEKNDEFKNRDVLSGTWTQLSLAKNTIDSQLKSVQGIYYQKIINEKDNNKVLELQKEYSNVVGELQQKKSELEIANHNAKMKHQYHDDAKAEIKSKGIGSEIALANPLAGTVTSGEELFTMIALDRNPFQMKWSKDNKGNTIGQLHTYNSYIDESDENSGLTYDDKGRIVPTDFVAPVLKINNFMQTKNEITDKVDKTAANNIVNEITKEVNDGSQRQNSKTSTNVNSINTGLKTAWDSLSEGSRSYMMSNALNGYLNIPDGTKDGKWMDGSTAMVEIEKNKQIYLSDKSTKEEKEKAYKQGLLISDAIVKKAKTDVLNIAAGRATGLYNISTANSLTTNRNAAGDIIDDKNTSKIESIYGKFTNVGVTAMRARNPVTGIESKQGNIPIRQLELTPDEHNVIANELLSDGSADKGWFKNVSTIGKAIVGGITVKLNSLYSGNEDIKIINIKPEVIQVPAYKSIVSAPNGWEYTDMKYDETGNRMPTNYSLATIEIPSDWKVPIIGPDGKTKLIPINSLNKEEAKKINAVKTTKENANSKWYKGGDDEMWTYDLYIPAPSQNATGGKNTINRKNTEDLHNNMLQVQAVSEGDQYFAKQKAEYNKQKANDLLQAKSSNPNVSILTRDGKAIEGNTPEEKLTSIQKVYKIDKQDDKKKITLSREAIYKLYNEGSITNEESIELNNELNKIADYTKWDAKKILY